MLGRSPAQGPDRGVGDAQTLQLQAALTDGRAGQRCLDELLDSLLTSAVERGSCGWCRRVEADVASSLNDAPDAETWHRSAFRSMIPLLVLVDDDEDTCVSLSREQALGALASVLDLPGASEDLLANKGMASHETADAWLQLACFQDVPYARGCLI